MGDLTDFLLARIAEDEASVRQILAPGWSHDGSPSPTPDEPIARVGHWTLSLGRVLAECEAKRRVVELFDADDDEGISCGDRWAIGMGHMHGSVLRLLAQPYADHPDFREEWGPSGATDDVDEDMGDPQFRSDAFYYGVARAEELRDVDER